MKLKLLFLSMLLVALSMNAQYTVEDHDGNLLSDGQEIFFNTVAPDPGAIYDFYVNNTSTTDNIRMKIEFVSAVNADGSMMELCFGLCYTGITLGQSYPPNADYVEIAPGAQTPPGNHMANADSGNGTDVLEYVFRFYQIDMAGNEIGDALTVTYVYDPLLGINDNNLSVSIFATSINDELNVTVDQDLDLTIYDLQGRIVKRQKLNSGQQSINMSDVSSQMYFAHFVNGHGVSQTTKIVVK